jgi:biotin carboxylase
MPKQLVLISHVLHPAITEGFVPAAREQGYDITIVTDHGLAYRKHYGTQKTSLPVTSLSVTIMECDVFNPIAIIDVLTTQAINPQVVLSNSDHLQSSTALVAEYFSLPAKTWRCCYDAKNKAAMRLRLQKLSLPSVESTVLQLEDSPPDNLSFPVVAKPREGVASMNVVLCQTRRALQDFRREYHRENPTIPLLLETYMEGELFTLETLSDGRDIIAVGGFDVQLSAPPFFIETGAIWNGKNSLRYRNEALEQIKQFGVDLGACHSEFIVTATGPKLVEINYRSVGDGREFLLDQLLSDSWFKTILSLHAGEPLSAVNADQRQAVIRYVIASEEGRLVSQHSEKRWQTKDTRWHYRPLRSQGESIQLSHSNKDYLGVLVAANVTGTDTTLMPLMEQAVAELGIVLEPECEVVV